MPKIRELSPPIPQITQAARIAGALSEFGWGV